MKSTYDRFPEKIISNHEAFEGWDSLLNEIKSRITGKCVLIAELYPQTDTQEIVSQLSRLHGTMLNAESCALSDAEYQALIRPFLTDDRVFGVMNTLTLRDAYDENRLRVLKEEIDAAPGLTVVYGIGASLVHPGDITLYFDMPRYEIQNRFRAGASNWKANNAGEEHLKKFKHGFFVEWRMADRRKRELLKTADYFVDTVQPMNPKMARGEDFRQALERFCGEPFRLVPYFAPEVWGGQWMKDVCGLDRSERNYAWAFDGVPEENSIFMRFGHVRLEFPALDAVFYAPRRLLGERVHARFGDEFPIRFDFLDTMGGQNLSLQVHPLTEYIQHTFGMHYTQDESYYVMDCAPDAKVYLGLKDNVDHAEMLARLQSAQAGGEPFPASEYVNEIPVKKHDHFLIPAGTIHCSGKDTVVLEISATPYIFTFKLWDWGRLGLDGQPRPVHLKHGAANIQWDRTTEWVKENLVDCFQDEATEPGVHVEKTGLHAREFIDTRRYTLTAPVQWEALDSVSVCNVVEGEGAVISSPDGTFADFSVHYAETFILPAAIDRCVVTPLGARCKVLRAAIR